MVRMAVALRRQQIEKLRRMQATTGASYAELMRRAIDAFQQESCSLNGPPPAPLDDEPKPKGKVRIPHDMPTPTAFVLSHIIHGKPQEEVAELAVSQYSRFGLDIDGARKVLTEVTAFLASLERPKPLEGQEACASMEHPAVGL